MSDGKKEAPMTKIERRRFRIEVALSSVCGFLFLLTLVWRDWIEGVFGWDPDHHSGSLEWGILIVLLAVTIAFAVHARSLWTRSASPSDAAAS
jgi:DMSO/TMAO reductase YedYZ heme-binding membrane subunit